MSEDNVPAHRLSWRTELFLATLVAIVPVAVAILYWRFDSRFALVDDDSFSNYQPLLLESLQTLFGGSLPFWSQHTACGFPLFARSLSIYPPNWIAYGLCALFGIHGEEIAVAHILHVGALAAAAFVYLRFIGTSRLAAAVASMAASLAGPNFVLAVTCIEYLFFLPHAVIILLGARVRGKPA